MDIMMRLKGAGFAMIANEFREREQRLGGGLPLQDFVEIVLQGLPRAKSAAEKHANVSALVDLFDEIDINGDGTMEFDEFTSFCVDAGMVATRGGKNASLKHRYVRHPKRVIKTANGCVGIEKVKWSSEFRKLLAIENTAKSVKLFDISGKFVAEVGGKSSLHLLPATPRANERQQQQQHREHASRSSGGGGGGGGSSDTDRGRRASTLGTDRLSSPIKDASAARSGSNMPSGLGASSGSGSAAGSSVSAAGSGVFILDAVFIFKHQWLALSTTDFLISFYDMNESRKPPIAALLPDSVTAATKSGPSFELIRALTITTTTAQLLLRFCEHAGLLFSSGNDFVLNVWKIVDAETKVLWKRLVMHQDMIMDLIEVPQHDMLVSCDLQRSIQLWDIHDCRSRGPLVGHAHGVKQLVYSAQHDLLLSAGFEFDAYGWDIASRQVVMRLAGHRAPLVGVQIALFQTERAVTADCTGVFKVWDISRSNTLGAGAAPGLAGSSRGGATASQAIQLESIDPSQHFARFEPTAFVCMHPHSRDLWTATAGTATLHCFRSLRVQQLGEIPLRAFYHYNANKFVVVSGPVCSIWDGETGTCLEEFTHVGRIGSGGAGGGAGGRKNGGAALGVGSNSTGGASAGSSSSAAGNNSNSHNGSDSVTGAEPCVEVLSCVQDQSCKKLVVVTERGDLGVFNALNLVQMRKCREVFYSYSTTVGRGSSSSDVTVVSSSNGSMTGAISSPSVLPPPLGTKTPTCGIVGLHYCSVNKLIVATDANESAILVIDDNTNHDSVRGMKETTVLRRLTHIPGGVAASAYGFHVCLVATISKLDDDGNSTLSLWDFETLSFVSHCEFMRDDSDSDAGTTLSAAAAAQSGRAQHHALHLLEFWDEFPVLLSADTLGGVYFYAAMPLVHFSTGQLLHSFANDRIDGSDAADTSAAVGNGASKRTRRGSKQATGGSGTLVGSIAEEDSEDDKDNEKERDDESAGAKTFITEATEAAARKLLRWRKAKPSAMLSTSGSDDPQQQQRQQQQHQQQQQTKACAVTSMKVVFDGAHDRYLLVTGDESGVVRLWDLSKMVARLALTKIPEIKCKYLRRGYHPKAMFTRDYLKDATSEENAKNKYSNKHHSTLLPHGGDWRTTLLSSDDHDPHFQLSQGDLKRLSRQRLESKKRSTALVPSLGGKPLLQQSAANRAAQQTTTANAAFAAAEAFFGGGQQHGKGSRGSGHLGFSTLSPTKKHNSLLPGSAPPKALRCHEQYPRDIELARAWQAHSDGLTSIEVSKNPDIIITCALDMRVFVWNWQGLCLGKLFDAENIGRWKWQFTKDDSKRQAERNALVATLIRDLELTPLEKVHRRRQTLYQEHTARTSLKDLQRVNTILLDHIISKNPELALLTTGVSGESAAGITGGTISDVGDGDSASQDSTGSAGHHRDERARDSARRQTRKHITNKSCSTPVNGSVAAPLSDSSQQPAPLQTDLRMHSLAQVGPLLCVNKFEYRSQSLVAASKARFAEQGDLRMDKKYLEQELSISFPTSLSSSFASDDKANSLSDVQSQIQVAHVAAKAAIESRATLERKTADMYSNLEQIKQRTKGTQHNANCVGHGASLDELLEPSEFLKQRIPASKLTLRPQTAPGGHKRLQQLKTAPLVPVLGSGSHHTTPDATGDTPHHHPPRAAGVLKITTAPSGSLQGSSSTPVLANRRQSVAIDRRKSSLDIDFIEEVKRHAKRKPGGGNGGSGSYGLPLSGGASSGTTTSAAGTATVRRKSVLGRAVSSNSIAHTRRDSNSSSSGGRENPLRATSDSIGGGLNGDDSDSGSSDLISLRKLRAINQILAKAQGYCSPVRESPSSALSTRPSTAPFARVKVRGSSASDSKRSEARERNVAAAVSSSVDHDAVDTRSAEDVDDDSDDGGEGDDSFDTGAPDAAGADTTDNDVATRAHLEETKRKMASVMRDGERSPYRGNAQHMRQSLQQQQKTRRMEDYLQQKRREMNTNIGNVFKRTSFAFQSKASDDPMTLMFTGGASAGRLASGAAEVGNAGRASTSKQKPRQKAATAANTASTLLRAKVELEKSATVFGIYGVREVMAVIRLFWTMDADGSGNISLDELLQYKHFFEKLGYTDMTTVFQAIDKDGNGHLSLKELLEICFHYATKYQIEEMLKLAKVGNVRVYLQGDSASSNVATGAVNGDPAAALSSETRRELLEIFRVFDKDGDGGVSMQELMEALRVDDDDVIAKVMAEQASKRATSSSVDGTHVWDAAAPSGITKDDVERLYREFDANQNAALDFSEFVKLMHTLYGPKSNVYFR